MNIHAAVTEQSQAITRKLAEVETLDELELITSAIAIRRTEIRVELAKDFNLGDKVVFEGKKRGRHSGMQVGVITDKKAGMFDVKCHHPRPVMWTNIAPEHCNHVKPGTFYDV